MSTLSDMGFIYQAQGQYQIALGYYRDGLEIAERVGSPTGEAAILSNMGSVYMSLGQPQQALDYHNRALIISRELSQLKEEGTTLGNMGVIYQSLGQYEKGLDYQLESLRIAKEIGDRGGEAGANGNIGISYDEMGQHQRALGYLQQALEIYQEIGEQESTATTLNNIGSVYLSLGQYERALDNFNEALVIQQTIGHRQGEGTTLNNIGSIQLKLGQHAQALDYFQQSLSIAQEIGNRREEGVILGNIGSLHADLEQYEQALDYQQRALLIHRETSNRAGEIPALTNIGNIYHALQQSQQALDHFQQALAIAQELGHRSEGTVVNNIAALQHQLGNYDEAIRGWRQAQAIADEIGEAEMEVVTLFNIGYYYENQGDNAQAIRYYQQAVDVIESIQGEIRVEELKASLWDEQVLYYKPLVSLLWDENHFEQAFAYAERARARVFLNQLGNEAIDFRGGASAELLEQEQEIRAEIEELHQQLSSLRNQPTAELDVETIAAVEAALTTRNADYVQLLTDIKLQSPEVAGLVSVDVALLADIQTLLDADTTLVEYFVTEDRTLAFIITRDRFETVTVDVSQDDLAKTISTFRDFASLDDPHPASLKQLYTWLISPLKEKLKTPVVGVIPHDVLHYLPFGALTDGEGYLSDEFSLFTLPSASALRFIQEKRKPTINTVLALGNPITTEPGLAPLQFAQQEAETVANLYEAQPLVGDLATESALRSQAGGAGIVHLAAHGQYNPYNPLFSVIYLAEDQEEDGRLEVHEIYGLDLTQATDLVVLSACETQVGAVSAGDEVVGLTRAFLYAGTPTVIASLWNVDDEATTLLMERFYTHLREGMGKAQALQQAQSDVRAQYPHPYYWAAFVLTGDPGPVVEVNSMRSLLKDKRVLWRIGILGAFLLLTGGAMVLRRRRKRVES